MIAESPAVFGKWADAFIRQSKSDWRLNSNMSIIIQISWRSCQADGLSALQSVVKSCSQPPPVVSSAAFCTCSQLIKGRGRRKERGQKQQQSGGRGGLDWQPPALSHHRHAAVCTKELQVSCPRVLLTPAHQARAIPAAACVFSQSHLLWRP